MIDINENYKDRIKDEGLTEEQYELCLADIFDKYIGASDMEWQDIVEKYGLKIHRDTLRKASNTIFGGAFVSEYLKRKYGATQFPNYDEEIDNKLRELEREKIKYRDERMEWQRQNYIGARVEQKLDKLEEELKSIGRENYVSKEVLPICNGDSDMLVVLSDLHIGQTFNTYFGQYNLEVARDRLSEYMDQIRNIQKIHDCKRCYVSLQGDMISNSIHKRLAVTNRENVIEQVKSAIEIISAFVSDLCDIFEEVVLVSVCGNHSRIDRKEDALHDERLDDLIAWGIAMLLSGKKGFKYIKNTYDNGIAQFFIRGKEYISVHGDFDIFSKQGVANLVMMLGHIPYAIVFGHMHSNVVQNESNVRMIRGGSLAGAGCDYTIEHRLVGKPEQIVCVCSSSGIKAYYPIEFNR